MDNVYKKIKSIVEYAIIFIIFFIGLRKGGYYKEDSLIGVYAIFLFSIIYFIVNWKNIKINKLKEMLWRDDLRKNEKLLYKII